MTAKKICVGFVALAILGFVTFGCNRGRASFTEDRNSRPAAVVVVSDHPAEFVPNTLTVHVGDTVQWYNTGGISHSVEFLNENARGRSFIMKPQQGVSLTFTEAGTYKYGCRFHIIDGMEGKIVVLADPNLTKVSAGEQR